MAQTLFLLFFLVILLLSSSAHSNSPPQQTLLLNPSDLSALSQIKNDLQTSNFLSTWNFSSPSPCTSFSGLICSLDPTTQTLKVSSLTLGTGLAGDSPSLTGKLSPAIANLTALSEFIVHSGGIYGTIPSQLGYLTQLQFISITNNLISGPIPFSFSNLLNLHTLDLGDNKINGQVPPNLTTLPNLKILILASNRLSGELPKIETQLLHLDLRSNYFSGQLPYLPSSLRYLSLSDNKMWGPLDNIHSLLNLTFLDLSMNNFNGGIPESLFFQNEVGPTGEELSSLLLQRNNLSGGIPAVGLTSTWTVVDLSHNFLSGELSAILAGVQSLYLNNNRFSGIVPLEYVLGVYGGSMKTLYLQHNYLTGFPLPAGSPVPESASLCLCYNCMVPPVGPTVCPASAGGQLSRPAYQCATTPPPQR
ncbi:leucine-rich repeat (LRR) family protein [Tasmannia lanceolata]|uniref:leucine-rich repeat (LRR) family protein n=1 Tax=Tasmannia lanceolata TaxID=3420 RepID=UPI004064BC27